MTLTYSSVAPKFTPQTEPIFGRDMVKNNAGGFVFKVTDETRLDRFLILGSESPTYYQDQKSLTMENAKAVLEMIKSDGLKVVNRAVEISEAGRAPKNEPAIFVLAMASAFGDEATRRAAFEALPRVCRIGTHLFHYAAYVDSMRGWGRGLRKAIANWYESKDVSDLAYQAVKYQARDGWSNRDLLRLSHPQTQDSARNNLYKWMVSGTFINDSEIVSGLELVYGFEMAKKATSAAQIVGLIRERNLPREAIPTEFLNDPLVWEALLEKMPATALFRNLATMTRIGLLTPYSEATKLVVSKLTDYDRLKKARVHPIQALSALRTYNQGHGYRSKASWTPVQSVVDALDAAFDKLFEFVEPTGKNILLANDISASMGSGEVAGVPGLSPIQAEAAMNLLFLRTEKNVSTVGFTSNSGPINRRRTGHGTYTWESNLGTTPINIGARDSIDAVTRKMLDLPMGGTDCSLAYQYAIDNKLPVDLVVVMTDNETYAGTKAPVQALRELREKIGRPVKSVVIAFTSTGFSIADPEDGGMVDIVGMDASVPEIIRQFATSNLG